ncbi:hypothetical protein H5410_055682 [Solanum commersonii]|uniref:Uncharacterized protein n=1 Tax=Solanum commersonii TaxID=4109 RepID=A0A9J5WK24_SOLCO|nr:hypothetical protein H5410_055682 [Solanum commersonii]
MSRRKRPLHSQTIQLYCNNLLFRIKPALMTSRNLTIRDANPRNLVDRDHHRPLASTSKSRSVEK